MRILKLLCVALATVLVFSFMDAGVVSSVALNENKILNDIEQKVYSTATIEDYFDDSHVFVVLSNQASVAKLNYTIEDFPEVNCTSVRNMTQPTTDMISANISGEKVAEQRGAASEYVTFSDFYEVDTETFNQILLLELAEPGKENVLAAIKKLEERAEVLYVGPNYYYALETNMETNAAYVIGPWDEFNGDQWAINKINLRDAWNITTGDSRRVMVGIIDEGIDAVHPDLVTNILTQQSREFDPLGESHTVTSVTDTDGHGTMIAGIIGARTSNQGGISGVNWNVDLVSLKLLRGDNGLVSAEAMAEAIMYAEEIGIPILNISVHIIPLGVTEDGNSDEKEMIERIAGNYPGLIICAAGNDHINLDSNTTTIPACLDLDNMIVVGATTELDYIWYNSNIGAARVDLFAPGAGILSTYPRGMCGGATCSSDLHYSYGYHYGSGTSLAAPYVTGVASLLISMYTDHNISVDAMIYHILNGVDVLSIYQGKCVTSGRLNAYKALSGHNFALTGSEYSSTEHIGYCLCGAYKRMPHTWINTGDMTACSVCGYIQ